jgi:hypothetical protein
MVFFLNNVSKAGCSYMYMLVFVPGQLLWAASLGWCSSAKHTIRSFGVANIQDGD